MILTMFGFALAAVLSGGGGDDAVLARTGKPCPNEEILVGVTGYGESPEFRELMMNDECNLWVQRTLSKNLLPEYLGEDWCAWAKTNRIHVMTIYGDQDGAMSRRLRDFWGDLCLGNNIGEYAGFLYQDEKSYAVGCGNLAYATAEARARGVAVVPSPPPRVLEDARDRACGRRAARAPLGRGRALRQLGRLSRRHGLSSQHRLHSSARGRVPRQEAGSPAEGIKGGR